MVSVAKYVFYRIKMVFWHNCLHPRVHREWSDCQHRGSQSPHTPLQKRLGFYWPCVDIRVYISTQLFSIPSPSRYNMQGWTLIHRRKVSRTNYLVLSRQGWWYTIVVVGTGSHDLCLFLYSNTAVDCLAMEPSLDSSFGNRMSKVCNNLMRDLGQWAKSDVLYELSETALITGCGLLWTTITWQFCHLPVSPCLFLSRRPQLYFAAVQIA